MYQRTDKTRPQYDYDNYISDSKNPHAMTSRERRMRYEHKQRKLKRRRRKLMFVCLFYFLLGMAVSAGLFFLGKDWIGNKGDVRSAEAAGFPAAGGALLVSGTTERYKGIVCLDAGHGGYDPGANHQEILEKDINLDVAQKAAQYLEAEGWHVIMTREEDVKLDNLLRAQIANESDADVFVSIHCNFLEEGDADGIEIYFDPSNTEGGELAEIILDKMILETGAADRGSRTGDFAVTRETRMPSVLVELGYLSDKEERELLMTDHYRNLLALGIANGIKQYLAG